MEPFFYCRDPPHTTKAWVAQCRSRTLRYGEYFVSHVFALERGLQINAFMGKNRQSDSEAELVLSAELYQWQEPSAQSPVPSSQCPVPSAPCPVPSDAPNIPWDGWGLFVHTFVESTIMWPWYAVSAPPAARVFTSLFAFHFLHVCRLQHAEREEAKETYFHHSSFKVFSKTCVHMVLRGACWPETWPELVPERHMEKYRGNRCRTHSRMQWPNAFASDFLV